MIPLLGLFYVFPPVYGALGRLYAPDLLLTGQTASVVLLLPARVLDEPIASLVTALVTGAPSRRSCPPRAGWPSLVAGVLSQDLLRRRIRNPVRGFRGPAGCSPS